MNETAELKLTVSIECPGSALSSCLVSGAFSVSLEVKLKGEFSSILASLRGHLITLSARASGGDKSMTKLELTMAHKPS